MPLIRLSFRWENWVKNWASVKKKEIGNEEAKAFRKDAIMIELLTLLSV